MVSVLPAPVEAAFRAEEGHLRIDGVGVHRQEFPPGEPAAVLGAEEELRRLQHGNEARLLTCVLRVHERVLAKVDHTPRADLLVLCECCLLRAVQGLS